MILEIVSSMTFHIELELIIDEIKKNPTQSGQY